MNSPLLLPQPYVGSLGASFLQNWHRTVYGYPYAEVNWYSTKGPTVLGTPVPQGIAIPIQAGSTFRPGVKCRNISDAWKVYNTLKGFKTPGMAPVTSGAGWKTRRYPEEYKRVFTPSTWSVWHPNEPPHEMTLDEVKTWPMPTAESISGFLSANVYENNSTTPTYTGMSMLFPPWYIEEGTGAVYLDIYYQMGGSYEQRLSGGNRTFLVTGRMGRSRYNIQKDVNTKYVEWNSTIGGVPVECIASYYSWRPASVTVPTISAIETFFRGITFTTL